MDEYLHENISLYIHFEDEKEERNISKITIDNKNNKENREEKNNPLKIAQNKIFVDVKWTKLRRWWSIHEKVKTNKQQYLRILKNYDEG